MNRSRSILTLKLNPNNKTDSPKITTVKSVSITETENKEVKVEEIKPEKNTPPPSEKVQLNFQKMYKELHSKFPDIINMDKPVMFAIGIHKELAKELKISNKSTGRWVGWYMRKSKYRDNHKEGAIRYTLSGEQCGAVTEEEVNNTSQLLKRTNKISGDLMDN